MIGIKECKEICQIGGSGSNKNCDNINNTVYIYIYIYVIRECVLIPIFVWWM